MLYQWTQTFFFSCQPQYTHLIKPNINVYKPISILQDSSGWQTGWSRQYSWDGQIWYYSRYLRSMMEAAWVDSLWWLDCWIGVMSWVWWRDSRWGLRDRFDSVLGCRVIVTIWGEREWFRSLGSLSMWYAIINITGQLHIIEQVDWKSFLYLGGESEGIFFEVDVIEW